MPLFALILAMSFLLHGGPRLSPSLTFATHSTTYLPGLRRMPPRWQSVDRCSVKAREYELQSAEGNLMELTKKQLLEILNSYGETGEDLTKREVLSRILLHQCSKVQATGDGKRDAASSLSRISAESQRVEAYASQMEGPFECTGGHLQQGTAVYGIHGPAAGDVYEVRVRRSWPPRCSCADSMRWLHKQRCRHVCFILIKCGVPYASVADGSWKPDSRYAKSIFESMLGPWTPVPLDSTRHEVRV